MRRFTVFWSSCVANTLTILQLVKAPELATECHPMRLENLRNPETSRSPFNVATCVKKCEGEFDSGLFKDAVAVITRLEEAADMEPLTIAALGEALNKTPFTPEPRATNPSAGCSFYAEMGCVTAAALITGMPEMKDAAVHMLKESRAEKKGHPEFDWYIVTETEIEIFRCIDSRAYRPGLPLVVR